GRRIGAIVDPRGSCCRYGGDEFAAFLPRVGKEEVLIVAEELRRSVADQKVKIDDQIVIAATISVGVASYPEDGDSVEQLLRQADRALYRAKQSGRNNVS